MKTTTPSNFSFNLGESVEALSKFSRVMMEEPGWDDCQLNIEMVSWFVCSNLHKVYMTIPDNDRQALLKGALYGVKSKQNPIDTYKEIALWIAMEDFVGDKEFSFRLAFTVPNACEYSSDTADILELYGEDSANRELTRLRMKFYIQAKRSETLKKDVI